MLTNSQIKHINSLKHGKYRIAFNEFIAEGSKLVLDLINSPYRLKAVYATLQWIGVNKDILNQHGLEAGQVTSNELGRITALTTAPDVFAIFEISQRLPDPSDLYSDLVLVLDNIRDPGNLGTIIRTADWFGIKTILCSPHCVDLYNPKVIQATMGSIARVNVVYTDLKDVLREILPGTIVYGAMTDGEDILTTHLGNNGFIIIGNESNGISSDVLPFIDKKISIPSYSPDKTNKAESLNAAIACAIICFEFRKRMIL
jgi:TrmH family RNA methyltransferase